MGNCCLPSKSGKDIPLEYKEVQRSITRDTHVFTLDPGDFIKLNHKSILKEYTLNCIIGRGAFGQVWESTHISTNAKRAIKQINLTSQLETEIEKLLQEVSILKHLDHPNVIKIFEVYKNRNKLFIVTEFCEGGELFDRIQSMSRFSENMAAKYMLDIVSAVMHCHNCEIIHRDLKPENFLFDNKSEEAHLKLIDFGCSRFLNNSQKKMKKLVGTLFYMAPELLEQSYDKKIDVWSLGVILHAMLSGSVPFIGNNAEEIRTSILNSPLTFSLGCWNGVSEEAKFLIRKMLEKKPENRYSIEQVFNDEWLQSRAMGIVPDHEISSDSIKRLSSHRTESRLQKTVYFYIIAQMVETQSVNELSQAFKSIDKNGDGHLSADEIIKAAENVGLLVDSKEIIKQCDIDKNGLVSFSEFLTATVNKQLVYNKQNLMKVFEKFDRNGDGKIDLEEIKEALGGISDDFVLIKMIEEADTNRDGVVDIQEFLHHMGKYDQGL